MKLSSKLSFFVLGVILPVILFFYLLNARLVLNEATKYEMKLGQKQGQRLKEQIVKQFEAVRASSKDWGGWDDTYYFVQGKKNSFIKDNLNDPIVALNALRSDFIAIINKNGTIVYSVAGDFDKKEGKDLPDFAKAEFSRITQDYFSSLKDGAASPEGFFLHPNNAVLFSANKILHSDYSGEAQGLVFLGRFLDERLTKGFKDTMQGELEFINLAKQEQYARFSTVLEKVKENELYLEFTDESLGIYLLLPDYKGKIHLLAYAEQERYMSGMLSHILKNEAFLWLTVAMLLIILFFVGNHYFILKKIRYFTQIFGKVKGRHDLSLRATEKFGDEFGNLAQGFNHMMSSLLEKQQQLVHSSKMASIGILTSGVAHEINNPLFIAKGYVQILIRKIKKDENLKPYEESLMQADNALTRIEEIVKTLQQYSKGNDGSKELVRLNHIIEDALVVSKTRMGKASIEVKVDIPQKPFEVEGTFSSIQQVVINILVNAIEALELVPEGERFLNISLSNLEHKVVLSITDSGPGIKPEILSKIYDPFFTTKEVGKGIGLGLFTVHTFVATLGGEITCESNLGKGTCFKVYFPEFLKSKTSEG